MNAKCTQGMVVQNYPANCVFNYVIVDKVHRDWYDTRQVFLTSEGIMHKFDSDNTAMATLSGFCKAPINKAKFEMLYSLAEPS